MNIALVLNFTGVVLIFSSAFMLLPFSVSFLHRGEALPALSVSFLITFFSGLLLYFLTKSQRKIEFKHRDGFAVVTISWLAISFFGSLPYIFSGSIPSFTDAYFEAMSGFTTTGASILTDVETLPRGILFWRSLTHWIGGMGIIVLSIAILPMLGTGGMQLFKAEVAEIGVEKLRPRIIDTAKSLWYIYALLTIIGIILLKLGGMDFFDAVCHSFGAVATGGFSVKNASIGHYQSAYIEMTVAILMLVGGTNFSLHFYALKGHVSRYWRSSEFKFYCFVVSASIALVTLNLISSNHNSLSGALRYAIFQVASIGTATGYSTANYEKWPFFSQMLLITLMFIGGMVGSTAGGIKQARILIMLKQAYRELYQLIHPHAFTTLKLDGKSINKETLGGIWGFIFLFLFIYVIAVLIMSFLGLDIITSLSTVVSSMSNVGPALGNAGPTENYSTIPTAGKWVLILCMLIGRLEIYTVIILFVPHFWRK
jgi:trk system potassium uptake protein TrkH